MNQQEQPGEILQANLNQNHLEEQQSFKKNRQSIEKLLIDLEDINLYDEQLQKEQELFKLIKRRMLQTNLTDRRAIGGLLGTAILGVIGLAVGLNVIGIIIGGILGALLGRYAGKRIKENALKKKKLVNINLHIIKFAAYVQHLIDLSPKTVELQEIRMAMLLLLSDCKMVIIYSDKFQKQEKRQVQKIQKKLLKQLKKEKFMYACLEMYWIVKQWMKNTERYSQLPIETQEHVQKEIARIAFNFLRPLSKLMAANRRMQNDKQKKFEAKINQLLITAPILNLREKFIHQQHLQEEAEQEFLENIYREVELKQLKEMMEDQIAQDILKEDQIQMQNQQQQQEINKNSLSNSKNQYIDQGGNIGSPQDSQMMKEGNQDNMKFVVWNYQQNSSGINNPNPNQFQSNNNKSRLIDLIHLASQQKQQEEDFASYASHKLAHEHFQSHFGKSTHLQNNAPRVLLFEKMAEDKKTLQNQNGNELINEDFEKERQQTINNESNDALKVVDNNNGNNQGKPHHNKNLSLLDQQFEQFLEDQRKNENGKQSTKNTGYIPQKFLSNNGIDDQGFASHTQSSVEAIQQPNEHQSNKKIPSKNELIIKTNHHNLQPPVNNIELKDSSLYDSHLHEQKFESNACDPANYQTYVEEANAKTVKKAVQIVYQKRYQGSRNLQSVSKIGRSSYANVPVIMNEEELQAAIQELKFDNQMLNQNQDKRIKQIINQNNNNSDASPTQSFMRNKRGDVFLKMNSFDSIMTNENPMRQSMVNNNQDVVIDIDQLQQNQNQQPSEHKQEVILVEESVMHQNFIQNPDNHQKSSFCENKENNRHSINSLKGSVHQNNVQLIFDNQSSKNNDSLINLSKTKTIQLHFKDDSHHEDLEQNNKLVETSPITRISQNEQRSTQKQETNINRSSIVHQDIENNVYYAKDDQEPVDRVIISELTSSQMKKNSQQNNKKVDTEIEQKLIRLKELDDENPEKTWDRVINKDRISIYKKQIPNNPSVMVRAEAFVGDCSQEEVFEQIYYENYRKKWDKVTLGFSVIEKLGEMQDIIYFYIDPGFGVTKRDFLQKRAVRRDYPQKGEITIVFFSTTHPSMPETKGTIRAISHIAAYIIRPVKEGANSCHLTIITQSDVKGQIPKYIVNFLSARAPAKWIESMKKGVFDHRKGGTKKK